MDDLLLLIYGLTKAALVFGVMVLVATAPSGASATAVSHGQEGSLFAGLIGASTVHCNDSGSMSCASEDDDTCGGYAALDQTSFAGASAHHHEVNHWRHDSDHESHRSSLMEADHFEHSTNIDGTPMCGDFDINGNVYGVTESHFDSWDCGGTSSMFD